MIMYLLDKQQRIIKAIDKVIIEATMVEEINTANQLTFSVMTNSRIDTAIQYVCIPAPRGDAFLMFKLISETVKNDRVEYTAVESAYDELKAYSYIKDMRPSSKTAGQMLEQVIQGTRWSLGYIADTNQSSTSFYYITVLEAIQKIVELFNVELTFDVNIDKKTNVISSRRINLYTQQGERTGKRFEYGSNLLEVTREQSSENLITALVGRGKGEEVSQGEDGSPDGYGRRITFTDVEWKKADGNPTDKPRGQEYVEDKDATALYGFSDGRPRIGLTTFEDITDPQELLKATWASLQIAKRPQVAFKASVLDVGDLGLGDTVAIIRHDLGIEYFTRVYKVEHDLLDKANNTIELGDDFSQKSLTNYVADVAKIAENVKNTAEYAVSSASGKNKNYYSKTKPQYASEGDNLFLDLGNGETELYAWHNGNWELIVSSSTSQEVTKKIDELMADAQAMSDHAVLVDKQITDWTNELGSLTDYAQNLFKQVDATSNKLDGLTIDTKNLFNQADKTRQTDLNAINQRFASMAKDTEKAIQDSTSIKVFSGDLDDLKNSGTYKGESGKTQHTPPSVDVWYVVSVDAYSPAVVLQTYTDITSKNVYTRRYYGSYGWSSWVKYYNSSNLFDNGTSKDLNDYTANGWYIINYFNTNNPLNVTNGTLQVLNDGIRITQILDDVYSHKLYIRYKFGQYNWGEWQDFASTKGVSEMYDSKIKISKKEIEADFAHTISDTKTEITTNYMSAIKARADSARAEFSKQITDTKNLVAKDYTAAISVSAEQLSAMFNKSLADQKKTISESYTSAISASAEGLKADYLATIKNAKEQLTTDYNHSISVSADASKELFQKTITDTKNAITNDYIAAITKTASSLRASFSEQITQTNNTVDSLTNYPLYNGDLNNLKKTGIWKTDGNTKNKANNGPYGVVKVDAYSSYIVVQTYYDTTNGFSYVRRYYGNAEWDNWKRLSNENDLSNLNNAITTSYKSAIEATSRSLTSAYQKEITDSKNTITTSYTSAIQQTASALRGEVTQKLGAYVTTTTFNAKASGWDSGVKEAKNGVSQAETHITQLKDDINLRFLEKGKVVSQINLDSSGVLIDGKKVHITGQTLIDDAAIKSAKIDSLDANKLTVNSTLDASKVHVINLDANNITANRTNFIKSAWNSISGYVNIDGDGIAVGSNRSGYVKLSENGIFLTHHYNNELVGHIGTNNYAKEEWRNGLEFGLQYPNGDFMSWGVQKQQDGPYIDVMVYNRNDGTSPAGNCHLGDTVTFYKNVLFNSNIYGQGTTSPGSSHLHFQDIKIGDSMGLALLNDNGRGIWIGNNGNVGINATGSWLGFQGLKLPTEITPDGKISKWISL